MCHATIKCCSPMSHPESGDWCPVELGGKKTNRRGGEAKDRQVHLLRGRKKEDRHMGLAKDRLRLVGKCPNGSTSTAFSHSVQARHSTRFPFVMEVQHYVVTDHARSSSVCLCVCVWVVVVVFKINKRVLQ